MPSFDDTPEGRYESLMYYGQWTDGDTVSALVSKDEDIAALRSRIATLEAQLEQARTALEGICRCDRYPMHCAECPAAQSYCASFIAGQALREGGTNA